MALAQTKGDSILIQKVYLISREDSLGDILVNVLITGKTLKLITRDEVLFGRGVQAFDGGHGFLFGNVVLGKPPSFVILNENPRKNFDVILNTSVHTTFAIDNGVVKKNTLNQVRSKGSSRRISWSAYQAPPLAVPINYYSARKWNKFDTKIISGLFNGVLALDRLRWISQDDESKAQVGELSETSVGALRALRFGIVGTINFKNPWIYTIYLTNNSFDRGYDAKNDNGLKLYDLRIDIPLPKKITLSVGKQKEPISMERLMSLVFLPIQERQAAADAFLPIRNYGVVFNGNTFQGRGTWGAGVFKNFVDSDTSFTATPTQFTGRITGLPLLSADESNLLHVGLGLRYSTAGLPLIGKVDAEFFQAPTFIKVKVPNSDYLFTYDFELYWRKGPFLVGGEYIGNRIATPTTSDLRPDGFNVTGAWTVTGEMRKYRRRSGIFDPVPVSRPVGLGGYGALELVCRYSDINLSTNSTDGGRMRTYSVGANWWLSSKALFGANYRLINLQELDSTGLSSGLNFRLMLILE